MPEKLQSLILAEKQSFRAEMIIHTTVLFLKMDLLQVKK